LHLFLRVLHIHQGFTRPGRPALWRRIDPQPLLLRSIIEHNDAPLLAGSSSSAGYINITGITVAHFGQRSFQRKIKGIGIGTQFSQGMNPLLNALSSVPIFPDNKALATVLQGDAVDPGSGKLVLKATYKIESVTIKV